MLQSELSNSEYGYTSMMDILTISDSEFNLISQLVYDRFGIWLGEHKKALVAGRLNKIVRERGFSSFRQYYDYILSDSSGQALSTLINRISTNHTYFYRESAHFDFFASELERIAITQNSKGLHSIRIWSAGCSSGEEAYTLAMVMSEVLLHLKQQWELGILATDISEKALSRATDAIYQDENVKHLPLSLKLKYLKSGSRNQWHVDDSIKRLVMFRRFNLMNQRFPFKRKFHAIFCRNVMIYFDQASKDHLLNNFSHYLEDGGKLFLGLSESLGRTNKQFKYVQPGVYEKVHS